MKHITKKSKTNIITIRNIARYSLNNFEFRSRWGGENPSPRPAGKPDSPPGLFRSVELDRGEQVVHEPERREEPDGAGGEHDRDHHEERVAEVERGGDGPAEALEVEDEVVDGVEENVDGDGARGRTSTTTSSPRRRGAYR